MGSLGQGPGEYQLIYDAQIDEAGEPYILTSMECKISVGL
ncbi:6-bladed beta-propeller [Bacteroides timonensis]|nr:6-bladed beta-propeller [Bacteroides timonensis]